MRFVENQSGTYARCDEPDDHRRFDLCLDVRVALLSPSLSGVVSGHVAADGLTEGAELAGTLSRSAGALHYELEFEADDGRTIEFRGIKQLSFGALPHGLRELSGELLDGDGGAFATTTTSFSVRADLIGLLASIRLR